MLCLRVKRVHTVSRGKSDMRSESGRVAIFVSENGPKVAFTIEGPPNLRDSAIVHRRVGLVDGEPIAAVLREIKIHPDIRLFIGRKSENGKRGKCRRTKRGKQENMRNKRTGKTYVGRGVMIARIRGGVTDGAMFFELPCDLSGMTPYFGICPLPKSFPEFVEGCQLLSEGTWTQT